MAINNNDITIDDQNAIMRQMGKMPQEAIHKGLGHLLMSKTIQPHEAVGVLHKIQKVKEDDIKQSDKAMVEKPKPPTLEETAISNHLKGIAEKAHNPITSEETTKSYGKDLVGAAIKMHPITGMPHIFSQIHHVIPSEKPEAPNPESSAPKEKRAKPDVIQSDKSFRTINYGDLKGTPEDATAKRDVKKAIKFGSIKIGKSGDTFNAFKQRIIPAFKKALDTEPDNTTIVTHSSVLKGLNVWNDMKRPDIEKMTPEQKEKFATKYNSESMPNGDVVKFPSKAGSLFVVRHGQTEDNKNKLFRTDDDTLTDKGELQATEAGQEIKKQTGAKPIPKIITSDLSRAIKTSQLIHAVTNGNNDAV